jgi:DNA helicase HerA-like ATPase
LAGLSRPNEATGKTAERIKLLKLKDFPFQGSPVTLWDIDGSQGHPVRTTMSEMGPLLLSRIFGLNEVQAGVLTVAFRVADEDGRLLLDVKDLREMLRHVSENAADISARLGRVSAAPVGAIQRALLDLESQGADKLFGEPALAIEDFIQTDGRGRGMINILAADKLLLQPKLYASFLLWLLSELFENLPEVGDLEKPKLVFIFDEAHLLFDDAPEALRDRVEQVVRIIRSKGVGVYFCSQFPDDVPDEILGQLGNRVQHALRAFTPRDQKAVRTAAETFVANPKLDVAQVISTLGVGEALVSTLQDNGVPMPVQRTMMAPPRSRIGAITADERATVRARSPIGPKYDTSVNRESAYEMLKAGIGARGAGSATGAGGLSRRSSSDSDRAQADASGAGSSRRSSTDADRAKADASGVGGAISDFLWGTKRRQGMVETMAKQTARTVGGQLGRQILRGMFGGILGGRQSR